MPRTRCATSSESRVTSCRSGNVMISARCSSGTENMNKKNGNKLRRSQGGSPRQPHQPVNAGEQRGDGKIRLLHGVTRDVQQQRRQQNQQAGPTEFQRLRQQLTPFPPKKPDDQKRDEVAVAVVGAGIVILPNHPRKQRWRVDVTEDGVA